MGKFLTLLLNHIGNLALMTLIVLAILIWMPECSGKLCHKTCIRTIGRDGDTIRMEQKSVWDFHGKCQCWDDDKEVSP